MQKFRKGNFWALGDHFRVQRLIWREFVGHHVTIANRNDPVACLDALRRQGFGWPISPNEYFNRAEVRSSSRWV
ncbi:hypothetical protein Y032_0107g3805 [Ancylostoma ceylanicum]|uniref:Uncharacterized protein n=1 Tax=Ancylostoma ceylanicum TaxID=53326 RepID=A0A016TFQ4_9BILA|nr:hypothetical protein Y032_0107g3805 [Ancylostoma ceylanicum]